MKVSKQLLFILLLLARTTLADVNDDVTKCLGSKSKITCVQTAINKEEQNQINTLVTTYTNFVSSELASNVGTPEGTPGTGVISPPSVPTRPKTATPPGQTQAPTSPQKPPQSQGGIQYY